MSNCIPGIAWKIIIREQSKSSEWLLLNINNKLHFDEMIMMSTTCIYYTNNLSYIFIVLEDWSNILHIYMLLHSDNISQFRVRQSLLLTLDDACFTGKSNKYQLYGRNQVFLWTTWLYLLPLVFVFSEHASHYTTDAVR